MQTLYAGVVGMLLSRYGRFIMEKLKSSGFFLLSYGLGRKTTIDVKFNVDETEEVVSVVSYISSSMGKY